MIFLKLKMFFPSHRSTKNLQNILEPSLRSHWVSKDQPMLLGLHRVRVALLPTKMAFCRWDHLSGFILIQTPFLFYLKFKQIKQWLGRNWVDAIRNKTIGTLFGLQCFWHSVFLALVLLAFSVFGIKKNLISINDRELVVFFLETITLFVSSMRQHK